MKEYIHTCMFTVILTLSLLSPGRADVLTGAMSEDKGSFLAYKDNKFFFKTEKGQDLELSKAAVRKLTLDEPREVYFLRKGKSKNESALLVGYDKLQFSFKQKKQDFSISAMNVASIKASMATVEGGGTEGGTTDGNTFIAAVDLSGLDETALSPSQKAAISSYAAVRTRYESFLSRSSTMVAEMDRSSGARREELLGELRRRKNEEQPIRLQMSSAHKSLLAAFPGGFPLKANEAPAARPIPIMPPPGESAKEVIEESIDVANGEVLLIDTSSIAKSGILTDKQMKAMDAYDRAAVAYEEISAKQAAMANAVNNAAPADKEQLMPLFEEGEKDATKAKQAVLKAQAVFLKAFPQLQLTE